MVQVDLRVLLQRDDQHDKCRKAFVFVFVVIMARFWATVSVAVAFANMERLNIRLSSRISVP